MDPAARDDARASDAEANEGVNEAPQGASKTSDGPPDDDTSDRELVERVQSGDHRAFRLLFERYHRRAYAVAYGVVKNQQDALDIVQDGFVKVHKHIGKFQGSSSFYTWLYRIVMNLAIDHVRRRKNSRGVEYDDRVGREADEVAGDGALLPRVLDTHPGKTVARRELLEKIQQALDELPEYHRAVILLREIEGLSYEEMAQTLGVPKGTIMSRLFHARKKMQAALGDYVQGDLTIED
ncbi:MAG TPA: sigma-70 family RNA polymerase sigma factor [Sandaracinaceae bacterium LLY-WYZ-13_1]|nr:sigma-70 family RNA polymerase sigma factor [Sandaracinaceae bacterium LLY-WYZ-13_1]